MVPHVVVIVDVHGYASSYFAGGVDAVQIDALALQRLPKAFYPYIVLAAAASVHALAGCRGGLLRRHYLPLNHA